MPWGDWKMDVDYLYSRGQDSAYYVDLAEDIVGMTSTGMPIYDYIDGLGEDNYMLTNSSSDPKSSVFSLVMTKQFDFGLDVLFGYAYTDSEDVVPMTSATAFSNFENVALHDIALPQAATSNYMVPNRFTLRLDYEKAFFGDNLTRLTLFGYINEGQAQSYVMDGQDLEGDGYYGRHLLYVPDGPSDPNVVFAEGFDQEAFFDWVDSKGLAPGYTERNQFHTSWSNRWDFRISQEIPMGNALRGRLYFKVYNLGNMLNDDWGKIVDAQFFSPEVIDTDVNDEGQYVFNRFSDRSIERTYINRSLWEAKIGIDIKFGL